METLTNPLEPCEVQCPLLIRETMEIIGTRWAIPLIVVLLTAGGRALRYSEIHRRLPSITAKELARHLRRFEVRGIVSRSVHPTIPPQVEYALTARGTALAPALEQLALWAAGFSDR